MAKTITRETKGKPREAKRRTTRKNQKRDFKYGLSQIGQNFTIQFLKWNPIKDRWLKLLQGRQKRKAKKSTSLSFGRKLSPPWSL